jgi:tetratricopeptide (TPR) repeat protein
MRQYEEAIPLIERLLELDPDNANFNFKMAYAIIRGSSYKDPLPYLEKAITNVTDRYRSRARQTSAPVDALWYIALEHFYNYNYEVAESYFLQYKQHINELHDNYDFCIESLDACKSGPILMKSPVNVHVRDFSEAVSLPTYFHSGLFSPDEAVFVFTADRNLEKNNYRLEHRAYNDDIFSIYYKDSVWSEPRPLSVNINSTGREASVGMHPN